MRKATFTPTTNFDEIKMISRMNVRRHKWLMYESLAFMLALDTGLRASDLLNLKMKGSIKYDDKLKSFVCVSDIKKTGKRNHKTIVSAETEDMYRYVLRNQDSRLHYDRTEFIFTNPATGKQFTRFWLNKRAKHTFGINFHQLRKISALRVLEVGSLADAQKHLAHARATTTDLYLGVTETDHLERMKRMHPKVSGLSVSE